MSGSDPRGGGNAAPPAVSYPGVGHDFCFDAEERSFWFAHRNKVILAVVSRFPPAGPIIDVGAGNGYVSAALQRAGWETIVVEPGSVGAAHARSRGVKNVICAPLEKAGIAAHSAGAVALFDVVEHIEDDTGFLISLRQYLAPAGRVYMTVPAHTMLWSSEDAFAGHFRRYSVRTLAEACGRAGLTVEYASYFFSLLPLPIFLVRVLPEKLRTRPRSVPSSVLQHDLGGSSLRKIADVIFSPEARIIGRGGRVPIGASCIVVARVPA